MANRFIEGKFNLAGNLELVTQAGSVGNESRAQLVRLWRDQNYNWQPSTDPHQGEVVSYGANSPGAILQDKGSTSNNPGDFHVLVMEGTNLVHYQKDNSNTSNEWQPANPFTVSSKATGEASFIQSNLGPSNNNFDAVVLEGSNLVHYFKDNSTDGNPWVAIHVITDKASLPGCIIQSNLGPPGSPGNFEVVVVEGTNLVHYYCDNSSPPVGSLPSYRWSPQSTATISSQASSPGCIIQSNLGPPGSPGNFEVVVAESPLSPSFVHYYRDNSSPSDGSPPAYAWSPNPTATIATSYEYGQACLIQSNYGGPPGNFEVVALVGNHGLSLLLHYWRNNTTIPPGPWQLGGTVAEFELDASHIG